MQQQKAVERLVYAAWIDTNHTLLRQLARKYGHLYNFEHLPRQAKLDFDAYRNSHA